MRIIKADNSFFILIITFLGNPCKYTNYPGKEQTPSVRVKGQELSPTSVNEYLYNSEKVYLFDTWKGPDDFTRLYSSDGELMAYFGGFTGKGDGRCTDFSEAAVFIRTVYADGRWIRHK